MTSDNTSLVTHEIADWLNEQLNPTGDYSEETIEALASVLYRAPEDFTGRLTASQAVAINAALGLSEGRGAVEADDRLRVEAIEA